MIRELTPYQLAVRSRKQTRIIGANGKWFATECPKDRHGTSVGYNYWLCECDPCVEFKKASLRETYKRRKHNRLVLMKLQHERQQNSESVAEDSAPAPEEVAEAPVTFPDEPPTGAPDPAATPPVHLWDAYTDRFHRHG
jgi:hypothetical protein